MPAARILQPNFYVAFMSCNVSRETLLLGKPPKSGSARLGHIPSLPWESQLPLKPCISLHPSDFEGNCDSLRFSPRFLLHFIVQFHLLRKCGLLAHTSAAFLKNCCTEKLFVCLRLVYCNPISMLLSCHVSRETLLLGKPLESGSARLGHIPSLPWESQLPLKPCISLHPSDFEGNCDSSDFLLDFCCSFIVQFDLLCKCGLLAHTSAAFLKNCCTEKLFVCLRLGYCSPFLFCFYVM